MKKNQNARTFKDYLNVVEWTEVAESFKTLICVNKTDVEDDLKIYFINFHNFRGKQWKSSNDIIRISNCKGVRPPIQANLFSVEDNCSYVFFDWAEILDMEVRVEGKLTLTDADIVAICIWQACDGAPETEESMNSKFNALRELYKSTR